MQSQREVSQVSRVAAAVILAMGTLSGALAGPGTAHAEPAYTPVKAKSGYFRTSDGVRLHYLELGKGRPIVFVPGWTVPAWMWDPQIRHFAKEYRVIALDPRSQGKSGGSNDGNYTERRATDIKELVDKLKLAPVVLVGHSLAVTELASYVDQFGTGTLAGLVFVDQDFGPYPSAMETPQFLRQISLNRRQLLEQMMGFFYKRPTLQGYTKMLIDDAMRVPTNTALALLAGRAGMDLRSVVAKIGIPVLYAITPQYRETGEWLKKSVPTARVEVFEDTGYVIFQDDPDRFNSALERFARASFERRYSPP